jgi:hypothetical protein
VDGTPPANGAWWAAGAWLSLVLIVPGFFLAWAGMGRAGIGLPLGGAAACGALGAIQASSARRLDVMFLALTPALLGIVGLLHLAQDRSFDHWAFG